MNTPAQQVGVVGLGSMGAAVARRLLDVGMRTIVFDVRPEVIDKLVAAGALGAASPATVAQQADVVLTLLPDPAAVAAAYSADDGIVAGCGASTIAVDLTTGDPSAARATAAQLDGRFLDAGVLGNPPTAAAGSMILLVGGDPAVLAEARPVLDAIAKLVFHLGGPGAGHTAKLTANELFLAQVAAMGEALALLQAAGLAAEPFLDALAETGGRGVGLADIGRTMQSAPPASGFALRLAAKDATLLVDLADVVGHPAPIAHTLADVYGGAALESPDSDFTCVARYQRSQAVSTG